MVSSAPLVRVALLGFYSISVLPCCGQGLTPKPSKVKLRHPGSPFTPCSSAFGYQQGKLCFTNLFLIVAGAFLMYPP